jgi:phosphoglycolate phosphatase
MIKLIIFDYDGVIVDSFPNTHDAYKTICKKLGKSCPEKLEDFRKVYGHTSSECYQQLGILSEEEKIKGNAIYKEEILKKEAKPFKGIIEVIKELHKRYKLALISSTYKEEVEQKLKKFGLLNLFDFIFAREGTHVTRFEKTDSIKKTAKSSGIKLEEVLIIGDRNVDFIESSRAGLKNVLLVDYGWGYNLDGIPEYDPKAVVKKPKDILEAVKKY